MPAATDSSPRFDPQIIAALGHVELVARTVVDGFTAGLHRSVHRGQSVEFAHHREYGQGDDPRHLDWRVWARTDRFFIKQYDEETNMRVCVLLDTSASMGYRSARISKLDYGRNLAACLAYIAIQQGDPAGLVLFDASLRRFLAPRSSAAHLRRIWSELQRIAPGGSTGVCDSLRALAERLKRRGLIVLISDLLDEPGRLIEALAFFRRRRHEVIVFHLLDPAELQFPFDAPHTFVDPESRRRVSGAGRALRQNYLQELDSLLCAYRKGFAANAIDYELLDTATAFDLALRRYLTKRSAR